MNDDIECMFRNANHWQSTFHLDYRRSLWYKNYKSSTKQSQALSKGYKRKNKSHASISKTFRQLAFISLTMYESKNR